MRERVFVYGSLKRRHEHHEQMAGAAFEGGAVLLGYRLVLYEESYPAIYAVAGERVTGEVFSVSEEHLSRLDRFEDCPELYQRREVTLEDGSQAWTYVIPAELGETYPRLDGPWRGRS